MKIGLVGAGYWGQKYVRIINETPGVELSAVHDIDERKRWNFGSKFFASYEKFTRADFDAAIVTSPAKFHFVDAVNLLEAGKHVLVEKPFAFNEFLHKTLVTSAENAGRVIFPAHIYWHNDYVDYLAKAVNGMNIRYIQGLRQSLGPVRQDCGVLYDLIPHDLSILQKLGLETPDSVQCSSTKVDDGSGKEGFVSCTLKFNKQNVLASLNATWLYPTKLRQMTIAGDRIVTFDDTSVTSPVKIYSRPSLAEYEWDMKTQTQITAPFIEHKQEPLKSMFDEFIAACNGEQTNLQTYHRWALNITRILEHLADSIGFEGEVVCME